MSDNNEPNWPDLKTFRDAYYHPDDTTYSDEHIRCEGFNEGVEKSKKSFKSWQESHGLVPLDEEEVEEVIAQENLRHYNNIEMPARKYLESPKVFAKAICSKFGTRPVVEDIDWPKKIDTEGLGVLAKNDGDIWNACCDAHQTAYANRKTRVVTVEDVNKILDEFGYESDRPHGEVSQSIIALFYGERKEEKV